jgi:hypothetical protein
MTLTLRHPLPGQNRQYQKFNPLFDRFFGHRGIQEHPQTQPKRKRGHVIIIGIVILLLVLLLT